MANTATLIQKIPAFDKEKDFTEVLQYKVTIDTLSTDLTIHTPAAGNRVGIMGIIYTEADAASLEFKTASTSLLTLEMPASSGIVKEISSLPLPIITKAGEALKINVTGNNISTMLLVVAEFSTLRF